jgi:ubiquinone/menaquinone biosynthesis C-methylase UbiE
MNNGSVRIPDDLGRSILEPDSLISTEAGLKRYYEISSDLVNYEQLTGVGLMQELRRSESLAEALKLTAADSLLDTGCGEGLQLELAHKSLPTLHLAGIDISEERITRARKRLPEARLAVASAIRLPFESAQFTKVICSEILEHLPYPERVIQELARVLQPGGLVAISVPYRQRIPWDTCIHCGRLTSGHINSFSEENMSALLDQVGFEVLSARGLKMMLLSFPWIPYRIWKILSRLLDQTAFYRNRQPTYLMVVAKR